MRRYRSMARNQSMRTATTTALTSTTSPMSFASAMPASCHESLMAFGSCMPRSTNTMPLSANVSTCQTLEETMFMRATEGPMRRSRNEYERPAATTARMPETCRDSAARKTTNGVARSKST